jgi:hypothetical protein
MTCSGGEAAARHHRSGHGRTAAAGEAAAAAIGQTVTPRRLRSCSTSDKIFTSRLLLPPEKLCEPELAQVDARPRSPGNPMLRPRTGIAARERRSMGRGSLARANSFFWFLSFGFFFMVFWILSTKSGLFQKKMNIKLFKIYICLNFFNVFRFKICSNLNFVQI